MPITYNLKSSLLKFALVGGEEVFRDFCVPQIKKHLNAEGKLINTILSDWQSSSGPLSLGRHLLTDISINALNLKRKEEHHTMGDKQKEFEPILDSLKNKYPNEYKAALNELYDIVDQTRNLITSSGEESLLLFRRLSVNEGLDVSRQLGNKKIHMDVNILSSYTPINDLEGYTGKTWSNIVIQRHIPIDQIIFHPSYIQVVEFEFAEKEAIIYNPYQRVVLQHPDKADEV